MAYDRAPQGVRGLKLSKARTGGADEKQDHSKTWYAE